MFSSPSSTATAPSRRSVATTALRGAGLTRTDDDVSMRDSAGGVKRSTRNRPHDRPTRSKRLDKMELDAATAAKERSTLAARLKGAAGSSISIRGAAPAAGALASRLSSRPGSSPGAASRIPRLRTTNADSAARPRGGPPASIDILRQIVNRRWNPETQFLNLEHLAEDELMKKHKLASLESPNAPKQLGPVLFKIAGELQPPCRTISLANNNLTNTANLSTLNHYVRSLNALSLENNKLRNVRDFDGLSTKATKGSLSSITELVLRGNPLIDDAVRDGRLDSVRNEVLRRFPMLSVLDQETLPRVAFDLSASTVNAAQASSSSHRISTGPEVTSFPVPMRPSLFLGGVDPIVAGFLERFFTLFDSDRNALGPLYGPASTFSICANTGIPPRARRRGFQHSADMPFQKDLNWDAFRGQSRNLERMSVAKAFHALHTGPEEIGTAFTACPRTQHDITHAENLVVDAYPLVGILSGSDALFINVHGQFAESPSGGTRSFDRSFVLGVAGEGSEAQKAGWPVVIISDLWVVRGYSHPDAWAPGELVVAHASLESSNKSSKPPMMNGSGSAPARGGSSAPGGPSTGPVARSQPQQQQPPPNSLAALQADPILASVPDFQKPLLIQLAQQTGLTIQFAGQCLEGNEWDIPRALNNFNQVKDTLPAEAFLVRR